MRAPRIDLPLADATSTCRECSAYHDSSAARRLDLLTEHSTDVLCELREGVVTYLSPNAARISGLRPDDVVAKSFVEFLHPADIPVLAPFMVDGWTGPIEAVFRIADASGNWQWREARGLRTRDAAGAHQAVLILRDINDRRRAELALQDSEEK